MRQLNHYTHLRHKHPARISYICNKILKPLAVPGGALYCIPIHLFRLYLPPGRVCIQNGWGGGGLLRNTPRRWLCVSTFILGKLKRHNCLHCPQNSQVNVIRFLPFVGSLCVAHFSSRHPVLGPEKIPVHICH